jgi:hypothetical protein
MTVKELYNINNSEKSLPISLEALKTLPVAILKFFQLKQLIILLRLQKSQQSY